VLQLPAPNALSRLFMVTGRDAAGDRLPEVIGALHVGRRERSRAERPSIPASGLLPFVTEDRRRSFCRPTWRRSEDEFATISITSGPVFGRISGPKVQYFGAPTR
jgi:hypothetical protein